MMRKKEIRGRWLNGLDEAVKNLDRCPTSIRLANELYEIGLPLLKQNELYVPLIPYTAELAYIPTDDCGIASINFERHWSRFGWDKMRASVLSLDGNGTGVVVIRQTGARGYMDRKTNPVSVFWYKNASDRLDAIFGMAPSKTGIVKFGKDARVEEVVEYDLLFGKSPVVKRYA